MCYVGIMKKCTKCNELKDLDLFYRRKDGVMGRKSHCKECVKDYELEVKEHKASYDRDRYINQKKDIKLKTKEYYNKNKEKYRNYETQRRRLMSTKLSSMYKLEIESIYKKCKDKNNDSDIKYEVDHIVPIRNKAVCGLHVPWNLRIITKEENAAKSNKLLDITCTSW